MSERACAEQQMGGREIGWLGGQGGQGQDRDRDGTGALGLVDSGT